MKTGEANLNLNANVSAGYIDDYSSTAGSDHSVAGAGVADFSGFYHNADFLSFDVQPFYNQSRLNSSFQSMTASSGVAATATVFGGSQFPGSISYATTYDATGNYGIPGLANYTTHGNSDTLSINWGLHLDDLPAVSLSFSNSNSSYSIYGANSRGTLHDDTFSAMTSYQIAGFKLNGGYQYMGSKGATPEFLSGEEEEQSNSGSNSFFFGVGHDLPWHGNFVASATRFDISTDLVDPNFSDGYKTSVDTLNGGVSFAPRAHLNVGENTYYTDNLEGTLYNTLLTEGAILPGDEAQQSSHSLSMTGYANYDMPARHLYLRLYAERQQQTFWGESFASDDVNGTADYSNMLWGGSFNGILGLTETYVDTNHQGALGLNTAINYSHLVRNWNLAGGFSYSQNTQTVLIAYTTSSYTYNGSVGRRIGRKSYWGAYAAGSKSLLTNEPNSGNSSQSYSSSLSLPRFNISGSYSKSSGNALLTSTGLVNNPLPLPVVNPASVVLFSGRSYSVGLGSSPLRGLTLSANYGKGLSGTQGSLTTSNNNSDSMFFLMLYHFRKLSFQAGYSRLLQGFSTSNAPPVVAGSYYVGVMRWFNFF
jgi:hypothetical protein